MPLSVLSIEENLTRYFREKFDEREDTEISKFKSLSKGWETELFSFVYRYKTDGEKREQNLILRIYPGINLENKTKWEFEVLTSLYKAGYPVPETHFLELNLNFFGYPFIIMDTVNGKDMGEFFETNLQKNLQILGKLFVDLHNLDWRILSKIAKIDETIKPSKLTENRIRKVEKIVKNYELDELNPLLRWLWTKKDKIKFEKISILHNDFHPHNVIMSEDGKAYVIDWPACSIGDYRQDLGWTLLLTGAYSTKIIRDMVLKCYEDALGAEVKDIEFFEILAATRRIMDMFIFFGQSTEEVGIRNEALQQIKETAFHLEYISALVKEVTDISIPRFDNLIQSLLKE